MNIVKSKVAQTWVVIFISTAMAFFFFNWQATLLVFATGLLCKLIMASIDDVLPVTVKTEHDALAKETLALLTQQSEKIQEENQQVLTVIADAVQQLGGAFHLMGSQNEKEKQALMAIINAENRDKTHYLELTHQLDNILERMQSTPVTELIETNSVQETKLKVSAMLTTIDQLFEKTDLMADTAGESESHISSLVSDAVRALQFEDLCSQLCVHIQKRIEAMDVLTDVLTELQDLHQHPENIEHCKQLIANAQTTIGSLHPVISHVSHKAVSQQDMSEGSIELF